MYCNKYDADKNFSYMDGIPVKISEQYKPPKKITVPNGILNRHSSESIEDYDFSLEKSMIKKMGEWRDLRRTSSERRKQRLENEEQQCGNGERNCVPITETMSRLTVQSPEPVSSQQLQPSATVPVSQQEPPQCTSYHLPVGEQGVHSRSDPILTPVPVTSHSYYDHQTVAHKSFNISDFESDTSSPFDNMELKTLNDIEELAHVLQPNLSSSNCDIPCPPSSQSQHVDNTMTQISTPGEVSSLGKKTDDSYPPRINGMNLQYYSNYNHVNSNNMWPQISLTHHTNHHNHHHHNHSNHHNYVGALTAWAQPIPPSSYNPTIQSYVVQRLDRLETDSQNQQVMTGSETSSKSVPDIIQELELELKDKRASEQERIKRIIKQPARPASIGPTEDELKSNSSLLNPLNQLTESCQQLTMRLNEMGFPLARVARAVQRFGDSETRVLEFLLQMQRLEESGYSADRAELALIANKYNLTETVRYLETLKQLLDLGFVERKVMEALEKHSNDRDKALESLIS